MPDVSGPFDGSSFGQGPYYRDAGYRDADGVFGAAAAATAAAGDLGLTTSGLVSTLALGRAHVRGASYERTGTAATLTHPTNSNVTLDRIDRIVLRRDLTAKTVVPALVQGTPAATPVGAALTQVENGVWETLLHEVLVPKNSGTVLTVTDRRVFLTPNGVDTAWQTLTPVAPTAAGAEGMAVRARNGFGDLALSNSYSGTYAAAFLVTTLPVGFRPDRTRRYEGTWSTGAICELAIGTNGECRVSASPGAVTGFSVHAAFSLA